MFKYLGKKIRDLFKNPIDEEAIERLEELFYQADLGSEISGDLVSDLRSLYKKNPYLKTDEVIDTIKKKLMEQLLSLPQLPQKEATPYVILIIGVNGNGKTTSLAKLAYFYQKQGKKVLIAAADTFRAAAIDQLEKWSDQMGVTMVKGKPGSDPAAVVFDAIEAAKSRGHDIVLIDTAGRLHTKTDLMKELEKIYRVSGKAFPGAPHETLLVLDATIGQNGVQQAKIFHQFTPLTGLILTKVDGTAKGGGAIVIQKTLRLPIKYIGTGESLDDFQHFNPKTFVDALFD